jgi:sugar phosphate isomerase/epimerase
MKFASSSRSFAGAITAGDLTQLEWLDLCAAELELDGVVFDAAHFPRTDPEYLAQLKKTAVDIGLTVAGVAFDGDLAAADEWLEIAQTLGAPLLVVRAPEPLADADAWGDFAGALKTLAGQAKVRNVPLALRNRPDTLCASGADLKRAAKDVDGSWLRFALDTAELEAVDEPEALLPKTILALHEIEDAEAFAGSGEAERLIVELAGFRGFVLLDRTDERGAREAFHLAIRRVRAAFASATLAGFRS